jgi:phage gp29-like protein
MRNLQMNEQSAVILPQVIDSESRTPMFKLDLLSVDGKKNFDISKIKEYYKNLIFTSLFSDVLTLGQSSTGSFALGSIKNSLAGAYAERLIANIAEVLQNDLIKQTYILNGWNESRMGTFDYDGIEPADLETFSKAVQRMGATGYIPKSLEVVNAVLDSLGIDQLPEDTVIEDILPDATTRSGDGLSSETGGLNGTANSAATNDTSSMNSENAA